jgi:hypothetical protein
LTRKRERFLAHRVSAEQLVEALKRPTLRAESILDGLFAEAVIILEAEGDRLLYHTTWDTLNDDDRLEVHFAPVGGIGGIAETCKLYRKLNIPVAIIADLDLIANQNELNRILEGMAANHRSIETITKLANTVFDAIKNLPPLIEERDYRKRLSAISGMPTNWQSNDDLALCEKLRCLSNELDRMRRLKRGGIAALPAIVAVPVKELLALLQSIGIFLVPVGELEGWLASEEIPASKSNKAAWANAMNRR